MQRVHDQGRQGRCTENRMPVRKMCSPAPDTKLDELRGSLQGIREEDGGAIGG